jgi:hypothetical protein
MRRTLFAAAAATATLAFCGLALAQPAANPPGTAPGGPATTNSQGPANASPQGLDHASPSSVLDNSATNSTTATTGRQGDVVDTDTANGKAKKDKAKTKKATGKDDQKDADKSATP